MIAVAATLGRASNPSEPMKKSASLIPRVLLACGASLSLAGAACAASGAASARGGETLTGVCQKVGDLLAARPLGGPPGAGGKPPAR